LNAPKRRPVHYGRRKGRPIGRPRRPSRLPSKVDRRRRGWSAIVTGGGPPVVRRLGDGTSLLEVGSGASTRSLPSPSVGALSLRPPGLATFHARARYQDEEGSAERAPPSSGRGGEVWAWWARKGFDSQVAGGYSRSTSPSSAVCAGLLGDRGRSSVGRASFEAEHAARRGSDAQGESG
jgi:hypothetical protein